MSHPQDTLHLAVALEGTGWHPASWREPGARADELLTAGFWLDQVREAEAGLADLVTFEDSFRVQADRPDHLQGRLDPTLIAQRLGPVTRHVGLVPTVVATHTEPFHVSTQIATLDYVSEGRAGERVRVSGDPAEAALFGRRDLAAEDRDGLFDEAADHVEVQRRLWDSWEDDAEIRDATTGRFIDRDKLHYVDFVGSHFAVRGPSITPRPPQGQPLVTVLAHVDLAYRLAARAADVVFTTPDGAGMDGPCGTAEEVVAAVRAAESAVGREGEPLRVLGDVLVFLDDSADEARRRRDRLDATWTSGATGRDTAGDGRGITVGADGRARKGDAKSVTGTAADVADVLEAWAAAGVVGARLRPAVTTHDLPRITRELVPELQRRGLFRTSYAADTLRGHFGLGHPADRYAASHQSV